MVAQKVNSDNSDTKNTPEFVGEMQNKCVNNTRKLIWSFFREFLRVSEFLFMRNVV